MSTQLQDGQTLLFIGDSITDCGRRGAEAPLGSGYVKLFNALLTIREPGKRVTIINKGIGGHKVTDLQARWTDDVLRHKPDWLSIKVGINDLHTYLHDRAQGVSPAKFEAAYDEILTRTRKALPRCRLLLIDPFYISVETSPNSFRRKVLDLLPKYLAAMARMSRKFKTRRIQTHAMYARLLKHYDADVFCPEPVHPNLIPGHLAIAEAVYEALSRR